MININFANKQLNHVLKELKAISKQKKIILIAIDGRSGSGKSTLANNLINTLNNTKIIHLDKYNLYEGQSAIRVIIKDIIKPVKQLNKSQIYILEGIFSLHSILEEHYDYKIWVDCSSTVGYQRGIKRDIKLNGIDNSQKWKNYWLPKEEAYIKKEKPEQKANFVFSGYVDSDLMI